jgi:hypothetical protein
VVTEKVYVKANSGGTVLYCSYFTISLLVVNEAGDDPVTHDVMFLFHLRACTHAQKNLRNYFRFQNEIG